MSDPTAKAVEAVRSLRLAVQIAELDLPDWIEERLEAAVTATAEAAKHREVYRAGIVRLHNRARDVAGYSDSWFDRHAIEFYTERVMREAGDISDD